jgi:integrase/recombinase XerC
MPHLSPSTLTRSEQEAILRITEPNPRDHAIYSLALGTGLRLAELVGLNVGDVYFPDGRPRARVRIRPEIANGGRTGDIFLPDALVPKFRKFWAYKRVRGEGTGPGDALFSSQSRVRLSKRRVQFAWRQWQVKAGFDRLYSFHSIRHTASGTPRRSAGCQSR